MLSSTRSRAAAVAAATALALGAGAGVASAATSTSAVDGNTVSATFSLESGELAANCYAALAPTAIAPQFAAQITGGLNPAQLLSLFTSEDVTTLKSDGIPTAILAPIVNPSQTLSATNVPSNVYTLVTYCLGDSAPGVQPAVIVGDPAEAVMGSLQSGSSGDNLTAASSSLPALLEIVNGGGVS